LRGTSRTGDPPAFERNTAPRAAVSARTCWTTVRAAAVVVPRWRGESDHSDLVRLRQVDAAAIEPLRDRHAERRQFTSDQSSAIASPGRTPVNAQNLSSARSLGAYSPCTSHELMSLSNSASVGGASSAYAASATPPGSVRPQIAAGEAVVAARDGADFSCFFKSAVRRGRAWCRAPRGKAARR
jgi:hypothetical protein